MTLAPQQILTAALFTLQRALVTARNAGYPGSNITPEMLNELTQAIHSIPETLLNYREGEHASLEEIQLSFGSFNKNTWPADTAPDLLALFEETLKNGPAI